MIPSHVAGNPMNNKCDRIRTGGWIGAHRKGDAVVRAD
jgi:hypothetical protein